MKYRITSRFGEMESFRTHPHRGVDFSMPEGEPIRSIQNGVVEKVVDYGNQNIGKGVLVKWEDGKTAIYGHMSEIEVREGEIVSAGDLLGYSGNTGHSTAPHLHFGLKENGHFIDPSPYVEQIQNMNNLINHHIAMQKINFFDYFQQHMNLLTEPIKELKIQLANLLFSTDYFPLVECLKNIVKFFFFNA